MMEDTMDQAPDLIGPVIAYRAWRIRDTFEGARLRSMGLMLSLTGPPWVPGRDLRARCFWGDRGEHRVPVASCLCGFYVMHALDDLLNEPTQVASLRRERHTPPVVAGQVEVWGRSERYERGRRVEWCRVRALYRTPLAGTVDVDALAETYGVPVLDDPDGKIGAWREREPEGPGRYWHAQWPGFHQRVMTGMAANPHHNHIHVHFTQPPVSPGADMQALADAWKRVMQAAAISAKDAFKQAAQAFRASEPAETDPDKPIPGPRKDHLQIADRNRTKGARNV